MLYKEIFIVIENFGFKMYLFPKTNKFNIAEVLFTIYFNFNISYYFYKIFILELLNKKLFRALIFNYKLFNLTNKKLIDLLNITPYLNKKEYYKYGIQIIILSKNLKIDKISRKTDSKKIITSKNGNQPSNNL